MAKRTVRRSLKRWREWDLEIYLERRRKHHRERFHQPQPADDSFAVLSTDSGESLIDDDNQIMETY